MQKGRSSPRQGILLIDIAGAVALFILGIIILWGLFPHVYKLGENSWNEAKMQQMAESKMEEILSEGKFISTSPRQDFPLGMDAKGKGKPTGYRKWWGETDPSGVSGVQTVKVEVVWTEGNRVRRHTLTGAIAP